MADINEIYGESGNFLKTGDVQRGQVLDCKIKAVNTKQFGDNTKLIVELESGKSLVLNKTNAKQLAMEFESPDYSKWAGKSFKLIRTNTTYQGGSVECLRVV